MPTLDELKAKATSQWESVRSAPETLTDPATAGLEAAVRNALPTSQLADEAYPNAFGMADKMKALKNPRQKIKEVKNDGFPLSSPFCLHKQNPQL